MIVHDFTFPLRYLVKFVFQGYFFTGIQIRYVPVQRDIPIAAYFDGLHSLIADGRFSGRCSRPGNTMNGCRRFNNRTERFNLSCMRFQYYRASTEDNSKNVFLPAICPLFNNDIRLIAAAKCFRIPMASECPNMLSRFTMCFS